MPIEVRGLKEALATLNKIDPALRRQITKDMRRIAQPAIDAIVAAIPAEPPLSGMDPAKHTPLLAEQARASATSKWHWRGDEKKLVRLILNGKKPRVRRKQGQEFVSNVGTIIISANTPKKKEGGRGAAFLMADMANRAVSPRNLPGKLNASVGRAGSRFMWYGADKALPDVTSRIEDAAREIIKDANRLLAAQPKAV